MQISYARKGQILFYKENHSDSFKKFSETDIINMLEFLIDNILAIVLSVLLRYTDSDYPLLVSSNSSFMMSRASNVLLWSVTSLLNPQSI